MLDPELFMRPDGLPMAFMIGFKGAESGKVKQVVEKRGGIVLEHTNLAYGDHVVTLLVQAEVFLQREGEMFDYNYVIDCVKENMVLANLMDYRINSHLPLTLQQYDPVDILLGYKGWRDFPSVNVGDTVSDLEEENDDAASIQKVFKLSSASNINTARKSSEEYFESAEEDIIEVDARIAIAEMIDIRRKRNLCITNVSEEETFKLTHVKKRKISSDIMDRYDLSDDLDLVMINSEEFSQGRRSLRADISEAVNTIKFSIDLNQINEVEHDENYDIAYRPSRQATSVAPIIHLTEKPSHANTPENYPIIIASNSCSVDADELLAFVESLDDHIFDDDEFPSACLTNSSLPPTEQNPTSNLYPGSKSASQNQSCIMRMTEERWTWAVTPWSKAEDLKVLNFLAENTRFDDVMGGNEVWQVMEERRAVEGRNWQSMKERFREVILKRIKSYGLSEEIVAELVMLSGKSEENMLT